MLISSLTYNCNPESLGDVTPEDFVDAFENEISAAPEFRSCNVRVMFENEKSRLTAIAGIDLPEDPVSDYGDLIRGAAEKAFQCVRGLKRTPAAHRGTRPRSAGV